MNALLETLRHLIGLDTRNPGGDEPGLARFLHDELAQLGPDELQHVDLAFDGEPGCSYVYARFGQPRVLINTHLDTVPANRGWTRDPFDALITPERVIGLGAADIKGAMAALLDALRAARPRDCAVLFSGDEERHSRCMQAFLASEAGRRPTPTIVCEPTGCRAGVRHRGVLYMTASITREGGHSSRADRLPAPIVELGRLAADLHDWGQARLALGPPGFEGSCLNVAALDGGVAFNVVPETATLTFSLRPAPGDVADALITELGEVIRRRIPDARIATHLNRPAFATRDVAHMQDLLGPEAGAARDLPFWTEAAMLVDNGSDAIVFGPGHVEQAHTADEFVDIAQLRTARAVFGRLVHGAD